MNTRNRPTIHPLAFARMPRGASLNHRLAVLCLALVCAGATAARATTFTVSNTDDSGDGSLRAALASAADGDTIDASGLSGTILLTSGELLVTNNLTILGPGPGNLAVDGNSPNTTNRVFHIGSNTVVSISSLTITNGSTAFPGGGIYNDHATLTVSNCTVSGNSAGVLGGGIDNEQGTLTIANSTVSGNSASFEGGGIRNAQGTLTIANSTISSNSAPNGDGGGINNLGTLTIANSTISDNSARNGGGMENSSILGPATLTIANSTISRNSATGVFVFGFGFIPGKGGGIGNDGELTIANSTISGNSAGDGGGIWNDGFMEIGSTVLNAGGSGANVYNNGGSVTSDGYNLSSDGGGGFLTATGDQINIAPLLGPLQDNGGPTLTHALLPGSPAIDQGTNFSGSATDQRGFARPVDFPAIANATGGDGSDIGAFEVQFPNSPPVAQCHDVTFSAGTDCTANASIDNGSFDPDASDTITLTQSPAGPYGLGTTPVTLTVTDSHGASNSCSATVTVNDTTAPSVTCPGNISTNIPSGQTSAVVNYPQPTASDDCSAPTVVCDPPSGSSFPLGMTPVVCTATDGAGNTGRCSFTVTVNESVNGLDSDGDGVPDNLDSCPNTAPGAVVDADGCSIDQLVPCSGPLSGGTWRNHGKYVSSAAKAANQFLAAGLITEQQKGEIVSQAAKSHCGKH